MDAIRATAIGDSVKGLNQSRLRMVFMGKVAEYRLIWLMGSKESADGQPNPAVTGVTNGAQQAQCR